MTRIFLALSAFAMLLLGGNLLLGLLLGDFGAASQRYQTAARAYHQAGEVATSSVELRQAEQDRAEALAVLKQQRFRFRPHIWLGIAAALVTLLVNSISITYFIGTNRWSREVVDAFSLAPNLAAQSQQLKRQAFPFSFASILLVLGISGLGAAADPSGSLGYEAATWVMPHWLLAMAGTVIIAWCLWRQAAAIGANFELIQRIVEAAEAERARRGQAPPPISQAPVATVED